MKSPIVLKTGGLLALASCCGLSAMLAEEPPVPTSAEAPEFEVKSELLVWTRVNEPPELPGTPGVKGVARTVVQLVENPGLPNPVAPSPGTAPEPTESPENPPGGGEGSESIVRNLFVSATVFNHSLTYLTCHASGSPDSEVSVWSNLDFNHFGGGFFSYQVNDGEGHSLQYQLMMGLGNSDAPPSAESPPAMRIPQDLPSLPVDGPAFLVVDGGGAETEALLVVRDLHEIYRTEGAQLAAAYQVRQTAEADRKAFLIANPPAPQGGKLRFWSRTAALEGQNGGGQ